MFYGEVMEVRTYVGRIGRSSFDVYQELWQQGQRVASGTAVMVHFDYKLQKASAIPDDVQQELANHLFSEIE